MIDVIKAQIDQIQKVENNRIQNLQYIEVSTQLSVNIYFRFHYVKLLWSGQKRSWSM